MGRVARTVVIGTRASQLALWQSNHVKDLLAHQFPTFEIVLRHITTKGDRTQASGQPLPAIGGKGLFTAELEEALLAREIDLAVHSLKDLPTEMAEAFVLGAICRRASPWDVLVSRSGARFLALPAGARIGTSSLRRDSQLRRIRADLNYVPIRGNVDTRIAKVKDAAGTFDATVLAEAGIERLGLEHEVAERFAADTMLPAPGQGALAVQCRADDAEIRSVLARLDHRETRAAASAERSFLARLEAGCNTPVGALAAVKETDVRVLRLQGRVLSPDGRECVDVEISGDLEDAENLGRKLAEDALGRGAGDILRRTRECGECRE